MDPSPRRLVAIAFPVLLAAAALGFLAVRLIQPASGPETEIVLALKRAERTGVELALPGATSPLHGARVRFERLSVQADLAQGEAVALGTLDFTGSLGDTKVSSLGVERIPFALRAGRWEPTEGLAPRLSAIVTSLEARRAALHEGNTRRLAGLVAEPDAEVLGAPGELGRVLQVRSRSYRVAAWFIRAERDGATVSEEFHLRGSLPERPVDEVGTRRLSLVRREREFFFSPALM